MEITTASQLIADEMGLRQQDVANTLTLLDEGCTIPFISRYRKERTNGMDEVKIALISTRYDRLKEIDKRKATILATIKEQGKLTQALEQRIADCYDATTLEDLYLPYKPKRRTRAQTARENGLQPLADALLRQYEGNPGSMAQKYLNENVDTVEAALSGAKDIIAERVSEDIRSRNIVRTAFRREGMLRSKVVKAKADTEEAARYSDYFDFEEPLRKCSSHRLLAIRRGEKEGVLRVSITPGSEDASSRLQSQWVKGRGETAALVREAVADAYKRLLVPTVETEFAAISKERADDEAIDVFGENLRQLLLSAPLGQKRVLGVDPGFRTGCKTVCLDSQGNLLYHTTIFPNPPQHQEQEAASKVEQLVADFRIEAIAIGNGTASRETEKFIRSLKLAGDPAVFVVSEDGASIYSASAIAREEFPDKDVTVRGAVSIGRRLIDPLSELVKIDSKSIGVGQYQHDVDQKKLKSRLDQTVESCVNSVGVNLNTASEHLLAYVSGLGPVLAHNIVEYRATHGDFTDRRQLLNVARLGNAAYRQCAGFLRIAGGDNPLDNSAVHPESYPIVEKMAKDCGCRVADLMADAAKRKNIDIHRYVTAEIGLPTLTDIIHELEKPGRDPREKIEEFAFDSSVSDIESLRVGMELPGIVTNITKFGAFVDIGVHHDGLVHISQMADRYVSDPLQVVKLHQHVKVRVTDIDYSRKRISLSMRGLNK